MVNFSSSVLICLALDIYKKGMGPNKLISQPVWAISPKREWKRAVFARQRRINYILDRICIFLGLLYKVLLPNYIYLVPNNYFCSAQKVYFWGQINIFLVPKKYCSGAQKVFFRCPKSIFLWTNNYFSGAHKIDFWSLKHWSIGSKFIKMW